MRETDRNRQEVGPGSPRCVRNAQRMRLGVTGHQVDPAAPGHGSHANKP